MTRLDFVRRHLLVFGVSTIFVWNMTACSPNPAIPVPGDRTAFPPMSEAGGSSVTGNVKANGSAVPAFTPTVPATVEQITNTNLASAVAPASSATADTDMNTSESVNTNTSPGSGGIPVTGGGMGVANDPDYGPYLVDTRGMTLYVNIKDEPDLSNCDATCLTVWLPYETEANRGNTNINLNAANANSPATPGVVTAASIQQSLIGRATLPDGRTVLTYNHMPLYRYHLDERPGEKRGLGYSRLWWMVKPDGRVLQQNLKGTPPVPPLNPTESDEAGGNNVGASSANPSTGGNANTDEVPTP